MDNYALMSNQTLAKIKSNMIFKVAMYIRLSREDGDKEESSSVTNQRNIITRFINEMITLLLLMNMLMMDTQVRTLIDQHFKE